MEDLERCDEVLNHDVGIEKIIEEGVGNRR